MATKLYTATHKRHDENDVITPNVEKNEGIRPWLGTTVAPYLPLERYNKYDDDYFVLSTGKVVALDSLGFLVPAGLLIDLEAGVGSGTLLYTATDVAQGVKNAAGTDVVEDEEVIASMVAEGVTVSKPIGITPYSYYRASSDSLSSHASWDPTNLRYHNYQKQGRVGVLCDYVVEYPIIPSGYAPHFAGIAAAIGSFTPGGFVTFDVNSNVVPANCSSELYCNLVGQVLRVDTTYPKALLDHVKTRYNLNTPGWTALDKMPGSATAGYPENMNYAGTTTGTLLVNLIRF